MSDVRDILERGVHGFDPGDPLKQTVRRGRRRERIRRVTAGVTALAVAAAGGLFAWRTFSDSSRVRPANPPVIPRLIDTIQLPRSPLSIELTADAAWIVTDGTPAQSEFLRVDIETREVRELAVRAPVGNPTAAFGSIWVLSGRDVVRIDPRTGEILESIRLPDLGSPSQRGDLEPRPSWIERFEDRLVVVDPESTTRYFIDPQTSEVRIHVLSPEDTPLPIRSVTGLGNILWTVGNNWFRAEQRNRISTRVNIDRSLSHVATSRNALWAYDGSKTVLRFGLNGNLDDAEFDHAAVRGLAATENLLWIASSPKKNLSRGVTLQAYDTKSVRPAGPPVEAGAERVPDEGASSHFVVGASSHAVVRVWGPTVWVGNPEQRTLFRFSTLAEPSVEAENCDPPTFRPRHTPWEGDVQPTADRSTLVWNGPDLGPMMGWRLEIETIGQFAPDDGLRLEVPFSIRGRSPIVRRVTNTASGLYEVSWEESTGSCGSYTMRLIAPRVGDEEAILQLWLVAESIEVPGPEGSAFEPGSVVAPCPFPRASPNYLPWVGQDSSLKAEVESQRSPNGDAVLTWQSDVGGPWKGAYVAIVRSRAPRVSERSAGGKHGPPTSVQRNGRHELAIALNWTSNSGICSWFSVHLRAPGIPRSAWAGELERTLDGFEP